MSEASETKIAHLMQTLGKLQAELAAYWLAAYWLSGTRREDDRYSRPLRIAICDMRHALNEVEYDLEN